MLFAPGQSESNLVYSFLPPSLILLNLSVCIRTRAYVYFGVRTAKPPSPLPLPVSLPERNYVRGLDACNFD